MQAFRTDPKSPTQATKKPFAEAKGFENFVVAGKLLQIAKNRRVSILIKDVLLFQNLFDFILAHAFAPSNQPLVGANIVSRGFGIRPLEPSRVNECCCGFVACSDSLCECRSTSASEPDDQPVHVRLLYPNECRG